MLMASLNLVFLVTVKPYRDNTNNRTEIFNEFCILMCSHSFLILFNVADSKQTFVGWQFIAFAAFNIFINTCMNIYQSLVGIIIKANSYSQKRKENKLMT